MNPSDHQEPMNRDSAEQIWQEVLRTLQVNPHVAPEDLVSEELWDQIHEHLPPVDENEVIHVTLTTPTYTLRHPEVVPAEQEDIKDSVPILYDSTYCGTGSGDTSNTYPEEELFGPPDYSSIDFFSEEGDHIIEKVEAPEEDCTVKEEVTDEYPVLQPEILWNANITTMTPPQEFEAVIQTPALSITEPEDEFDLDDILEVDAVGRQRLGTLYAAAKQHHQDLLRLEEEFKDTTRDLIDELKEFPLRRPYLPSKAEYTKAFRRVLPGVFATDKKMRGFINHYSKSLKEAPAAHTHRQSRRVAKRHIEYQQWYNARDRIQRPRGAV